MRDSKSSLKNVRVLKKNMLFIQSYDAQINKTILNKQSLYQICGEVQKIKVKQNYKNHTAYVTYKNCQAAATAFVAFYHISQRMKILFGTVQYCKYFIRKAECRNDQCVFMHLRDKKNEIIVNDQIDEDVYHQHYGMAVKIIQDQAFQTLKKIINKKDDTSDNLLRRGIKEAAEVFHIFPQIKLQTVNPVPNRKLSSLQESLGSTQEDSLNECRQQPQIARPTSQKTLKKAQLQKDPDPQAVTTKTSENCKIIKNKNGQNEQYKQKQRKDFSLQEYINIQLIKKLVRQNTSKMSFIQQNNQQQYNHSSNIMIYKIVKN